MESTGEPRRVQCSAATAELLLRSGRHTLRRRGVIAVKGKGSVTTYWLTGRLGRHRGAGSRPRRTQSGPSGGVGASPAGETLSADEAARRAAVTADDLVTIVVAETAPADSARLSKDDSPAISEADDAAALAAAAHAEAEADAALAATQLAVLVVLDVSEDGTVRVVIDDTVTIDTSPDAVAESMSLGPRTASTASRDIAWAAALALAAAGDDA
jgi:transcription elongation GreA/GreB family factor